MPTWTAKRLADAVAQQLQLQIGQAYQTNVIIPFMNRVYEEIWNVEDWSSLVGIDSATIAANQDSIVLPKKWGKLLYIFPPDSTNNPSTYDTMQRMKVSMLRMGRTRWLQEYPPKWESTFVGEQPVIVQPASGSDLPKVLSSSASDTTQVVHVEGWHNGEMAMASVTVTGTTPVAMSQSFDEITSIAKSDKTVGTISVTSNDGQTVYATMAPWDYAPYYSKYQMDGAPTSSTSVYIIAKKRFMPFLHNMSAPFQDKIASPLIDGTTDMCMSEMRQQDYGGYYRQRMMERLRQIRGEQTEPMEGPIYRA